MKRRSSEAFEPDDRQLLARITAGDNAAFAELYDRYSAVALGIAWKIGSDRTIAEDVVQEAFLSVWRRPGLYNPEKGSVSSYLFGAVHHKAVDAIRHEESVKRREQASSDGIETSSGDEVVEAADLSLRRDKVRSALHQLSGVQKEALELAYLEGLTYSEVAEKLGIPLGTAKTRLRDGLIRLRGLLSQGEFGGAS